MDGQALRSHAGRRRLRVGVSYSAGIGWLKSFRETGSVHAGKWAAIDRRQFRVSTRIGWCNAAGRGTSPCAAWSASRPNAEVDYRSVWAFVHAEKLLYKKGR